jgi:hypothetical protein
MLKQDLQFNIENDLIVEMTNHDIAKQVLLEQEKHGSIKSLQIEVESLKRFMLELGYIPYYVNELSSLCAHGFVLKYPYDNILGTTREVSLEDAVALHNNNIYFSPKYSMYLKICESVSILPLRFYKWDLDFAHDTKILSKVGLQYNKSNKCMVSTLQNIDVNFLYKLKD